MAWVDKRSSGKYRVRYRDPGGRERSKTFRTHRDARIFKTEIENQTQQGTWVDPRLGKTPLQEFSEVWLGTLGHLRLKTTRNYRVLLNSQVMPYLFGPLNGIDNISIKRWVARDGFSPWTIRQSYRVLSLILDLAVENRCLVSNPAKGIKLPVPPKRPLRILTEDQIGKLAQEIGPLIYILSYGGLRFGEATALTGKDISGTRITVDKSVSDISGVLSIGPTKTNRTRVVEIPGFVELPDTPDDHLVFTSPQGTIISRGNWTSRVLIPALKATGLDGDIRAHDLRHTCAAILIARGVHPKAIQEHLGHSSMRTTMDIYGHLYPSRGSVWDLNQRPARPSEGWPEGVLGDPDREESSGQSP